MKDLKISIADNDNYRTFVYKQLFEQLGYEDICTLTTPESCISSLWLKPDVIFLDYSFGNFAGLAILKKIKAINPGIPVVLLSEIEEMNSAVEGLSHGAYELILKGDIEEEHIKMVLQHISIFSMPKVAKKSWVLQKVASFFW